jgi:hypothetical protein
MLKHAIKGQAVGCSERTFQEVLGDTEAEALVVILLGVPVVHDLIHVKAELHLQMGLRVLLVRDLLAESRPELRIGQGNGEVDAGWPAVSAE